MRLFPGSSFWSKDSSCDLFRHGNETTGSCSTTLVSGDNDDEGDGQDGDMVASGWRGSIDEQTTSRLSGAIEPEYGDDNDDGTGGRWMEMDGEGGSSKSPTSNGGIFSFSFCFPNPCRNLRCLRKFLGRPTKHPQIWQYLVISVKKK